MRAYLALGGRRPLMLPVVRFDGQGPPLEYRLRRSARARGVSLWVAPHAGLVVTAPPAADDSAITAMLARHERWIRRQLARWEARGPIARRWPYGPALPYAGEDHEVALIEAQRPQVVRDAGRLLVHLRAPTIPAATRLLKAWYHDEARQVLTASVRALGEELRVSWTRIRIGDQRSRWGSCSATGALSFNYRLVMMPRAVLTYVVTHELLHRRIFDHSPAFWRALAARLPDYDAARRWLAQFGATCAL